MYLPLAAFYCGLMQENYYQSIAPFSHSEYKVKEEDGCRTVARVLAEGAVPREEREREHLDVGRDCFRRGPWWGLLPVYRPFFFFRL